MEWDFDGDITPKKNVAEIPEILIAIQEEFKYFVFCFG